MKTFYTFFLFLALCLMGGASYLHAQDAVQELEEYGVSFGTVSSDAAPAPAVKKVTGTPLPQSVRIDEDMLTSSADWQRFRVCVDGYGEAAPASKTKTPKETKCDYFISGSEDEATSQAVKKAALTKVSATRVTATHDVHPCALAAAYDIKRMKTAPAGKFVQSDGAVYKLILVDKKKIKNLAAYDTHLANKIAEAADTHNIKGLPSRVTVFEDYTTVAAAPACVVLAFPGGGKFTAEITDTEQSGLFYDIKPDFAVRYTK